MTAQPDFLTPEVSFTSLSLDSRNVQPGGLFAAVDGATQKGTDYIPQAIEKGAAVILHPSGYTPPAELAGKAQFIASDTPRKTLAELAAGFYKNVPATVYAVTGTNGKTSVTEYVYQLLNALKSPCCAISTISMMPADQAPDITPDWTTAPDVISLYEILSHYGEAGFDTAAIEATSHGLDQYRMYGLPIKAAAFTNLSEDHLEYHADMEAYFEAKWRLFTEFLTEDGTAVINRGAYIWPKIEARLQEISKPVLTYGYQQPEADLYATDTTLQYQGATYDVNWPFKLPFQISNLLAAITMLVSQGHSIKRILEALATLKPVCGRMELAATLPNGAQVFIDYAHTKDGIESVIREAKRAAKARINVLFGAGGDRHVSRRIGMAQVVQELADTAYVVDDNPRNEDPAKIRADILEHCPKGVEFACRAEGVQAAMRDLAANDILILCGKGHETGITINGVTHPYSDHEAVKEALAILKTEGVL